MINYNNKRFRPVTHSETGEVDAHTEFHYRQEGPVLWATYRGGLIKFGTLTGLVHDDGTLDFRYCHVNQRHELMTGRCQSSPEVMPDGRIRLHERWQWTSGDGSSGTSTIEEVGGA